MSEVYLRKGTIDDLDLLFSWANDPLVRKNSFQTEMIPYENHIRWYQHLLERNDAKQYILMEDDTPVGQIRITLTEGKAEIGYSIAKEHRGKGFGGKIIAVLPSAVQQDFPEVKILLAKVKPVNEASKKVFLENGFQKILEAELYIAYERKVEA